MGKGIFACFSNAVPPDILDYPTSTDMVVREGTNVTLRCAATGTPQPSITWRREGGETIPLGNGQEGKWCNAFASVTLCRASPCTWATTREYFESPKQCIAVSHTHTELFSCDTGWDTWDARETTNSYRSWIGKSYRGTWKHGK